MQKALKIDVDMTMNTHFADEEPTSSLVDVQKALKIDVDTTTNIAHEESAEDDVDMTTNTHFADEERRTSKQHGAQKVLKIGVDTTTNIAHYALQTRNQQTNKHGGQRADNENMNMCQNGLADRKKTDLLECNNERYQRTEVSEYKTWNEYKKNEQ